MARTMRITKLFRNVLLLVMSVFLEYRISLERKCPSAPLPPLTITFWPNLGLNRRACSEGRIPRESWSHKVFV